MKLNEFPFLRKIVLAVLHKTERDISIKHPYVPSVRIHLNSLKHKGYWYFRGKREFETMQLFSKLIEPGMHVVEVGGHIGFISLYFMQLTGDKGQLDVFEPGSNNLPYIRRNLEKTQALGSTVKLHEKAVGNEVGQTVFYEDEITGQNNSVLNDFQGLKDNAKAAFTSARTEKQIVAITTVDHEFSTDVIDFIKIDVEGFEKQVVLGASQVIKKQKPMLMVEIQSDENDLLNFFNENQYMLFLDNGQKVTRASELHNNVFALHATKHAEAIKKHFRSSASDAS